MDVYTEDELDAIYREIGEKDDDGNEFISHEDFKILNGVFDGVDVH